MRPSARSQDTSESEPTGRKGPALSLETSLRAESSALRGVVHGARVQSGWNVLQHDRPDAIAARGRSPGQSPADMLTPTA